MLRVENIVKPRVEWRRNNSPMLSTPNQAGPALMAMEAFDRVVAELGEKAWN